MKIIKKDDFLPKTKEAMEEIAAIVKQTLGPGGKVIMIQRLGQALDGSPIGPRMTKDGVSVAEDCSSSDPIKDVAMQAIKAICRTTNTLAGDGTTTAIVLGEAILNETLAALEGDSTLNPQIVREAVERASEEVLRELKRISTPVKDMKIIREVATISANGDEQIGKIIAEAFERVGHEGVITVDEGSGFDVSLDVVEGYQFNKGAEYREAFFNNKEGTRFEAEDASVILYDGKLFSYVDLMPAIRLLVGDIGADENGQPLQPLKKMPPLVIVANEFSQEVLQFLLHQKAEMGWQVVPVLGTNMTHVRTGYYDDMAAYSGGTRLGNGNRTLSAIEIDDVGIVGRVIVDKYKTTFYDGQGDETEVLEQVTKLKARRQIAENPYDAGVLSDRIAAITNGIAKIAVGGFTELEIKEKYDRIEDALNAARAAIEQGVVAGGGTTLLRIAEKMNGDKSVGHAILKNALSAPFFQILENIGVELKQDQYFEILSRKSKVFDARNKKVTNAFKVGILDPVKVTRTALQNAVSIASLLCTAGGALIVTDRPAPAPQE